jgi:amino acid adenylation domain-containing protein
MIQKFCQEYDVPDHAFYLTAWALVLRAFTGTYSVSIGCVDCRTMTAEIDQCVLTVPRSTLSPERRVSRILEDFKDLGSNNVQEARHNTAVALLPEVTDPLELSWLTNVRKRTADDRVLTFQQSKYSVVVAISYSNLGNLPAKLSLVYQARNFTPFHAENLSSNITQAMQQLLAQPDACVKDIDIFSPLNTITVSRWNKTIQEVPGASLLEVIRGNAKHRPNHPAIHAWDGTVSYSELEITATQWAIYLQSRGVKAECLVPIMMDHSKWAVIGEVAILKAGGAFVPLDPAQPFSRIEDIVRQTKANIALSSPHHFRRLQGLVETVVVISDERTESLPKRKAHHDAVDVRPGGVNGPAYVLFTSGSTGRPKGCVVGYGALSDVVNQIRALKIGPESRVLQFASYTYGMSLIEIYCTLAAGATICVPSEDDRLNALSSVLPSLQITWAILTPSTTISITEAVGCLNTLVVAGEALTPEHLHSLADKTELIQAFGLTEWAGICCVSQRITSETDLRVIGRPQTARLRLADPSNYNNLAPVGAVAELLIEGPALADGYLGDPEQTAIAFPKTSAGGRLYRTGDLVQYAADGSLRYVSRKDSQVKIRGMRVELTEVQYQIRRACPRIEKVIVEAAATKNSSGIPILVAFLCPDNLSGLICTIKDFVKRNLPDYMCPSVYVPLQFIPMTISRKVDRKALRHLIQSSTRNELEKYSQSSLSSVLEPQTNIERLLHGFVADVLRLDPLSLGMGQNFISLGGDSVTAMLLVNNLRRKGYKVAVAAILRAQSLLDVASLVHYQAGIEFSAQKSTLVDSPSVPRATARLSHSVSVEQSFSQARIWFLQTLHPKSTWLLLPSATRLKGPLQVDALETAFSALVERHETLRTTFEDREGSGVQVVAPFQPYQLKVVDMPSGSNDDLTTALQGQQTRPMDLTKESWRVVLFRLSPSEHVLSIVLHHIICDGWSFDIFMKTLEAYYAAALQDQFPLEGVEPLPIQYRDFSIWQRQNKAQASKEQLAYWVTQLDGSQPAEFLCDKKRPAMLSGKASSQPVKIDTSLYHDVKRFCASRQVTPFTVLLAAFRATHYRLTGAGDATIGIPSVSRTQSELEGLIGYFGNVQCIRTKIESCNSSFQLLVHEVQSSITAAFENQDVPFDQIVSKLLKDRDVSRHPLVQVAFVLHSQAHFGQLRLEGLESEQLPLLHASRLDLEFHLYPGEEEDLHGEIIYSVDLFHAETIDAMLLVFYDILREGLRKPDTSIGSLPLTDGYSVLNERGLISPQRSQELSIIDLFDEQVHTQTDEVAVTDTNAHLTYSELHQRSSMLAAWLKNNYAFVEETPVGVYATRNCESIVAIMGILRASLSYVPFDVDAPEARTEMILSCLPNCRLVLVSSGLEIPRVSAQGVRFAYIADSCKESAKDVDDFLNTYIPPRPTSLAYTVFTSGTTGTPKGVMIEHQGVANLAKEPEIIAHTVKSKVSSHMLNPAFDASGFEIYASLLNGGTLVCIDKTVVFDFPALEATFVEHGIRRAVMTPAILKQSLISGQTLLRTLDILYVGGDKLDPGDVAKAQRFSFGRVRIFNCYGPTENSIVSTTYSVPVDEQGVNGVPIGRAIPNTGAYAVDRNLRLLPLGVLGELVVTGLGLARGYTNPKHDIGRFVKLNIGGEVAQVRAYRTGDMVRYRPRDAQLEFFGRMDQQVKIRGHRVELAEIDNTLLSSPFINAAVTVLQQEEELVSFVTVENTASEFDDRLEGDHVDSWKNVVEGDDYYGSLGIIKPHSLGTDFLGWISMYDGKPMDKKDMREWLQDTIAAILRCSPSSVLEVGTGSGMILFNIIGSIEKYVGLELSPRAVEFVRKAVHWVPGTAGKVNIQCGTASDIPQLQDEGPFDLAVINSVAQYFPSLDYLRNTIRDLARQGVKSILFGDIRSYALYQEFQVSKVLQLHGRELTVAQFRQHMAEIARLEKELLVDPAFFTSLPAELPDMIEHVEIWPKRMNTTNELSCYRYTAILHVKRAAQPLLIREIEETSWADFEAEGFDYESLSQVLQTRASSTILAVGNIPFKKITVERHVVRLLQELPADAGPISWSTDARDAKRALTPIDLFSMAKETGWDVEISWCRQRSQRGGLDAIFHRQGPRVLFRFPVDPYLPNACSNDPLSPQRNRQIEKELLEYIRTKLPAYMVPKLVRVLDKMPINNVGKVDRHVLEQRADVTSATKSEFESWYGRERKSAFATEVERAVWEEFTGVLEREIGVADSFFHHGGHSLMAIKLVSRINRRLFSTLSLSKLFQYPTVSGLAQYLQGLGAHDNRAVTVAYVPFSFLDGSYDLSQVHMPPGADVVDVLPVTECQAWFLRYWSLVSHSFIIHGELDVDRLRAAYQAVVRHHPPLRTVFTALQTEQVQVIYGGIDAPFIHEYVENLDCKPLCKDGNVFGALSTKFTLASRSPREHKLTLQLSHAQFDGVSLATILSDIARAYEDSSSPLSSAISFSHYLYKSRLSRPDALGFWKTYLQDSVLTEVPHPEKVNAINGQPSEIIQREAVGEVRIPSTSDITFSTLINAAIALTLARLVQCNDVTFVCVMSSRDVLTECAESVVGPCVNRCLLRVHVPEDPNSGFTALGLCRSLSENQARVSAYSHLGLHDVIENCTAWLSSDVDVGRISFVNHLPAGTATGTFSLTLLDAQVSYDSTDVAIDPGNQIFVRSAIADQQQACIQVLSSSNVMDADNALFLADRILTIAQGLSVAVSEGKSLGLLGLNN